ncbi:MAG: TIGR03016 family PEP-CTERM system-associated outer membrane protein [Pseudomonadota bacterium]
MATTNLPMVAMGATVVMARKCLAIIRTERPRYKLHLSFFSACGPRFAAACATWLLVLPNGGFAAEWRVDPHLTVTETYTDNVALARSGQEKSDFITEITPGISAIGKEGRSHVRFDYSPQILLYAQGNQPNRVNHLLSTEGKMELAQNWLFLDGGANLSRENASLLGPISVSNDVGTQNQTSIRTYHLSPYIVNKFGPYANYEIRYQRDGVSSSSDSLSNSQSNKYSINVESGPAYNRYKWAVKLFKEDVDYTTAADQGSRIANFDFSYFLTPRFALTATEGYEKYNFLTTGDKPQGNYWSAGINWQPSSLTNLKLSGGEHYYGRTYALDFMHRSHAFLWQASYNESVTTSRANFLMTDTIGTFNSLDKLLSNQFPDPLDRARRINFLIERFGLDVFNVLNNQTFLEKRGDASVTWYSGKTTFVLSVFSDARDTDSIGSVSGVFGGSAGFNNSSNTRQIGTNLLFDWACAPKTNININTGYSDMKFRDTDEEQKLKYVRAGVRRQLTPKATGFLSLRHEMGDSTGSGSSYRENAISASVNLRF